ncbi:MAG: hypothetical protein KGS61_11765, partial [Verrucomicrobia bacterium]|nr:hypothetical protein [Verrucomicrobiota bacterium]
MKKILWIVAALAVVLGLAAIVYGPPRNIDLLRRYPTTLTAGAVQPDQARPWQFGPEDVFQLSRFCLQVGDQLKVETGPAKLGIGYCRDGAVWAIVIPAEGGKLSRFGVGASEDIAHVWLRFHPRQIDRLFPPTTVSAASAT